MSVYSNKESCKNSGCQCTFQTPEEINSVIHTVENALQKDSMDYYALQRYGYNLHNTFTTSGRELYLYLRTLKRHYHSIVTCNSSTLSCKNVSNLIKSTNRIVNTMSCHKTEPKTLILGEKDLSWVAANPQCVPKEKWESCICNMIPKYTIEVQNFNDICSLLFELKTELINCDVDLTLKNADLKTTLIDCGIDATLIKKAIDCGLTFRYVDDEIGLVGANGIKLKLKDITGLDDGCLT